METNGAASMEIPGAVRMRTVFDRMHAQTRTGKGPALAARLESLDRLKRLLLDNKEAFAEALREDFGHRSRHETLLAEIFAAVSSIRHMRKNLKGWIKPRRRPVSWIFQPAKAQIQYQPLGTVGVIVPWNYPLFLAFDPLAAALAAGNRVMVKPSEYTPRTSKLTAELLAGIFDEDQVHVVEGGADLAEAFSRLPFDHLFFTGSTNVGRHVMRAAADNLTPVTLELGGKSPAIIADGYPLEDAVRKIVIGKLLNAGQTCIAPDYLLAPAGFIDDISAAFARLVAEHYPTLADNQDYSSIVSKRHYDRLKGLVDDARSKGAVVMEVNPAEEAFPPDARKIPPTLLTGTNDAMSVMQEEIFGPLLPVVSYQTLDEAIQYVNERPRPLALYYFDNDKANIDRVLAETISGGVTVNDTVLHVAQDDLPFGGVGPSGMGHYHGFEGFETFSKKKPVFYQSKWAGTSLLYPPYGRIANLMLKIITGR